jgi:hypothetical protein
VNYSLQWELNQIIMPSLLDNPRFLDACKPIKLTSAPKAKKKRSGPEQIIQDHICSYLLGCGWLAIRFNSLLLPTSGGGKISAYTAHGKRGKLRSGLSDVVAFRGNQALFIEVKTPEAARGKDRGQSDSQLAFERMLGDFDITYHLASSVEDVQKVLSEVQ